MEERIEFLQEEIKFWKEQSQFYQEQFAIQMDCIKKLLDKLSNNTSKNEHLQLIKKYLGPQDVPEVAKKLKVSYAYVENVLNDRCFDINVLKELYNIALINKKSLSSDFKEMIKTLKD